MTRLILAALITLATFQPVTSQTPTDTAWMMVQHDVADLEAWRDVFESGLSARQSAGELQFEIVTMDGPPATVLAIFEWTSEEAALAFVDDPVVRNAMRSAGVTSEPVITLHDNDPRYWITPEDGSASVTDMASGN